MAAAKLAAESQLRRLPGCDSRPLGERVGGASLLTSSVWAVAGDVSRKKGGGGEQGVSGSSAGSANHARHTGTAGSPSDLLLLLRLLLLAHVQPRLAGSSQEE